MQSQQRIKRNRQHFLRFQTRPACELSPLALPKQPQTQGQGVLIHRVLLFSRFSSSTLLLPC